MGCWQRRAVFSLLKIGIHPLSLEQVKKIIQEESWGRVLNNG
jgi:hypothetical protein